MFYFLIVTMVVYVLSSTGFLIHITRRGVIMPQAKAPILEYLVEPINDREKDSAMFVLEKIRSVIHSCKKIKQLANAWSWGRSVFQARFPEHYNDFYYTLHGDYDLQFDKIIEQMEDKK